MGTSKVNTDLDDAHDGFLAEKILPQSGPLLVTPVNEGIKVNTTPYNENSDDFLLIGSENYVRVSDDDSNPYYLQGKVIGAGLYVDECTPPLSPITTPATR